MNKTGVEGKKHISSHGYIKVYVGRSHPKADASGFAYEHRLIVEKIIGRDLRKNEKIHHIDGNKENNEPSNLTVVNGNAQHYVFHREKGCARRLPSENNPVVECECGCEAPFKKYDRWGRPRRYVSGHNPREKGGFYATN